IYSLKKFDHAESERCQCPTNFRDLNPAYPGRLCLSTIGVNECENNEWNECDENARCIDEEHLYRCECIKPYVNAAKKDELRGSVCRLDYCSDVHYCPANSTCINADSQAICTCLPDYIDIRRKIRPSSSGLDIICKRIEDVNECLLGLHNCSAVAICTDLEKGYECECPQGYTDGNPSEPGRICAALLCGLCHGHGDCVHDINTKNITCACIEGYTGKFCEIAPSKASLILPLILALIFLLLTLCCCLYFCLKTKYFRGRGVSAGSMREEILGSDYYTIPRAKLRKRDVGEDSLTVRPMNGAALQSYLNDGGSISTVSSDEHVERRVITDVTRSEVRTTTVTDAEGNVTRTVYGITSSSDENGLRSAQRVERDADLLNEESDAGHGVYDRMTKTHHNYIPGEGGQVGTERFRNEFQTTTLAEETNYF
ncbi:unnamed protein product, partial [Dracunculus medinensis]|uniref:EGF-like domain-containing protein n=1 Tax=Dracunculus medinensis TaxID=318479 RepID=A0A0N4UQJ1_DRAME